MSFTNLIETATATGLTINSTGNVGLGGASQLHVAGQSVPRSSKIIKVANGYQVEIGCQTFVFESLANMLYRIDEYYTNPSKIEEHFHIQGELPVILPKKK